MSASTPLSMPTANAHRTSTCTSITSVTTKLPSCFIYDGYLYRTECPVKHSEREQCPWLCQTFLFNGPPFICSPSDVSGPNPIEFAPFTSCKKCLPFSNSSAAAVNLPPAPTTVPSTADKMTAHTTAATCTSIKPSGTDPPAVKALQNGISYSYRFSCGRSAATVTECPYLCDRGPSNHTLRLCDKKDVSDPTTVPINSRLVCESCSLPRETPISSLVSSSSVVPSATCTSTSSTGTLCPLVKHHTTSASTSPLFQSRCGTTAAEIADCPFLCTTVDPAYIDLFRCVNADVSGKNTIFDEYHIESCVKCLPACS